MAQHPVHTSFLSCTCDPLSYEALQPIWLTLCSSPCQSFSNLVATHVYFFVFSWSCLKPCLTVCPCVSGSLPVCLSLLSLPQRVSLPLFSEANSTDRCHLQETPAWVSTIHNWSLIKQVCAWLSEWRNFCLSGPKKMNDTLTGFSWNLNLQIESPEKFSGKKCVIW